MTRNRNGTMLLPPETEPRRDPVREEEDIQDDWSWFASPDALGQVPKMPEVAMTASGDPFFGPEHGEGNENENKCMPKSVSSVSSQQSAVSMKMSMVATIGLGLALCI